MSRSLLNEWTQSTHLIARFATVDSSGRASFGRYFGSEEDVTQVFWSPVGHHRRLREDPFKATVLRHNRPVFFDYF